MIYFSTFNSWLIFGLFWAFMAVVIYTGIMQQDRKTARRLAREEADPKPHPYQPIFNKAFDRK